jgi:hypothetical protein
MSSRWELTQVVGSAPADAARHQGFASVKALLISSSRMMVTLQCQQKVGGFSHIVPTKRGRYWVYGTNKMQGPGRGFEPLLRETGRKPGRRGGYQLHAGWAYVANGSSAAFEGRASCVLSQTQFGKGTSSGIGTAHSVCASTGWG